MTRFAFLTLAILTGCTTASSAPIPTTTTTTSTTTTSPVPVPVAPLTTTSTEAPRPQRYSPPAAAGGASPTLEAIAWCESRGNPTAVSGSGRYRGKYQFDRRTWASVGGSGDPAAAPETEQDARAAALYARRGAQPWPECGR